MSRSISCSGDGAKSCGMPAALARCLRAVCAPGRRGAMEPRGRPLRGANPIFAAFRMNDLQLGLY